MLRTAVSLTSAIASLIFILPLNAALSQNASGPEGVSAAAEVNPRPEEGPAEAGFTDAGGLEADGAQRGRMRSALDREQAEQSFSNLLNSIDEFNEDWRRLIDRNGLASTERRYHALRVALETFCTRNVTAMQDIDEVDRDKCTAARRDLAETYQELAKQRGESIP